MRVTYHIPTEQFGFVEVENNVDLVKDGISTYSDIKALLESPVALQGLPEAEFRPILDKFLSEGIVESGLYEKMGSEQQMVMQCIKRSIKRIKSKE